MWCLASRLSENAISSPPNAAAISARATDSIAARSADESGPPKRVDLYVMGSNLKPASTAQDADRFVDSHNGIPAARATNMMTTIWRDAG